MSDNKAGKAAKSAAKAAKAGKTAKSTAKAAPKASPQARRHISNGVFLAPFHSLKEDPTLALERDLLLFEHLDELGYAEAWVGEHHSCGMEIVASPELMIAAAISRTKNIRLGTGVVSLPYHHPLNVANRIIQLDHMSKGRVMFGAGPGLLPYDASMLGVPIAEQRTRMEEALDVILRLFAGEVVSEDKGWYQLNEARCQLLPYSNPRPEVAVASTVTPTGGRLAGTYDLGMLCVAATSSTGYDALGVNWKIACDTAEAHGRQMDRSRLRLVGPVHLAESREQALDNVREGLVEWLEYFSTFNPAGDRSLLEAADPAQAMVDSGAAVIGTPDDAIAQLESLWEQTGGFGVFLQMAHNWARFEDTLNSYELFARHVTPHFNRGNDGRQESLAWAKDTASTMMGQAHQAAISTFQREKDRKQTR